MTIDAARSNNVNGVYIDPTGAGPFYCIDVAVPFKSVVVSAQMTGSVVYVAQAVAPAISGCPSPYTDATVYIAGNGGGSSWNPALAPFYAVFND